MTSDGGAMDTDNESPGVKLSHEIQSAVSDQTATFCCGGSVPIIADGDEAKEHRFDDVAGLIASPPVVLRWDFQNGKVIGKLTLPSIESQTGGTAAVEELLKACAPATFGKEGEDVLDESYRKAVKLDSDQFCTSFNPHEVGIVDAIAQSMLPAIANPFSDRHSKHVEHLGVIAELYKLNIYSGPSGKFKAHVDTPRSSTQFASLVVCLPHPHEGGSLSVKHRGKTHEWGWDDKPTDTIQWAAFYSDCEHEVNEVKGGHRITLTYNLYVHERLGGILRQPSVIQDWSLPLYRTAAKALASQWFMEEGGTLGLFCHHAYAHNKSDHIKRLPYALKGVDAIFYSVFDHLGLRVKIRAVMDDLDEDGYGNPRDYDSDDSRKDAELVSTGLHTLQLTEDGGDDGGEDPADIVKGVWPSKWRSDIAWFNNRGPKEMAVVHLAYGNETSITWHYSSAAIVVDIPAFKSKLREQLSQRE
ncbi:hypothetical protein BDR22DRAFT_844059 [Usnea florida]